MLPVRSEHPDIVAYSGAHLYEYFIDRPTHIYLKLLCFFNLFFG